MSQNYNFKSLQIVNKNKEKDLSQTDNQIERAYKLGDTKTIDFIMLDGTRQNFPYSHYLTSWLGIEDDAQVLKIFFATHLVTIKGSCLAKLYDHFIVSKLLMVQASDSRYNKTNSEEEPFVSDIKIAWKKEENFN